VDATRRGSRSRLDGADARVAFHHHGVDETRGSLPRCVSSMLGAIGRLARDAPG